MKITVMSTQVVERKVPNKNNPDKPWLFRDQDCFIEIGYERIRVTRGLGRDELPLQPGEYQLTEECFFVQDGKLQVGLKHIKPALKAARTA